MKLYHRTKPENVESILKYGLLLKFADKWKKEHIFKFSQSAIFLSKNSDIWKLGNSALFEVDIDETFDIVISSTNWEVLCYEDIPPERLTHLKD